jgi:hypothetical protein
MKVSIAGIVIIILINKLSALCSKYFLRPANREIVQITATSPVQMITPSILAHKNSRVSILTEIIDEPGSLHEMLRYFWKYEIDLTHIESRFVSKYTHIIMKRIF